MPPARVKPNDWKCPSSRAPQTFSVTRTEVDTSSESKRVTSDGGLLLVLGRDDSSVSGLPGDVNRLAALGESGGGDIVVDRNSDLQRPERPRGHTGWEVRTVRKAPAHVGDPIRDDLEIHRGLEGRVVRTAVLRPGWLTKLARGQAALADSVSGRALAEPQDRRGGSAAIGAGIVELAEIQQQLSVTGEADETS
jgi:hypothetical protein